MAPGPETQAFGLTVLAVIFVVLPCFAGMIAVMRSWMD
jgi:hypothetical protein